MQLTHLFSFITLPQIVLSVCSPGWNEKGLHCYYFSTTSATFDQAINACAELQAQLVDISDDNENSYLHSMAAEPGQESYWIGYEQVLEGIWRWKATGGAGLFNKWDIGEPDMEGMCARMTPFNGGAWRDISCDYELKYICKKFAQCGVPLPMPNAIIDFHHPELTLISDSTFYPDGTEAHFTCTAEYEYPDETRTKVFTCRVGGVWKPDVTVENTCKPTQCPPPPVYDFLQTNVTGQEYYRFGTVISYTCDEGYWFSAYETNVLHKYLTCQSDKQWRGDSVSHCSLKYCIRPVTASSVANTSQNAFGTVAKYTCNTGYLFKDRNSTKIFTCGIETWEPPPEECRPLQCPLHDVVGATPSTDFRDYDTQVIWICDKGLQYPDTSTRKAMRCLVTEKWDYPIRVKCQERHCEGPPPDAGETSTHNWNSTRTYIYEDKIIYICIEETWTYLSANPSRIREVKCGSEGDWIPQTMGDCTGDTIIVQTKHEKPPATEGKNSDVVGYIGFIIIAAMLLGLVLLDITTIGKHLAMMRENLCPAKQDEKKLVAEKANKWKKTIKKKRVIGSEKTELDTFHEENERRSSRGSKGSNSQLLSPKGGNVKA